MHKSKEKEKDRFECRDCKKNLDSLLLQAVEPITSKKDMQTASLPRNFSANRATNTQTYPFEWPRIGGTHKSFSNELDGENFASLSPNSSEIDVSPKSVAVEEAPPDDTSTTPAASFFMR